MSCVPTKLSAVAVGWDLGGWSLLQVFLWMCWLQCLSFLTFEVNSSLKTILNSSDLRSLGCFEQIHFTWANEYWSSDHFRIEIQSKDMETLNWKRVDLD